MSRDDFQGPKLPKGLLDQVGGKQEHGRPKGRNGKSQDSRKDRRKAQRTDRKQLRTQPRTQRQEPFPNVQSKNPLNVAGEDTSRRPSRIGTTNRSEAQANIPKSVIAHRVQSSDDSESDESVEARPTVSRAVRDKLAEDDAEIAALEKRLGLKAKAKSSKGLHEDGLDFLLDDLPESGDERKRKREDYEDFIRSKRQKPGNMKPSLTYAPHEASDDDTDDSEDLEIAESATDDDFAGEIEDDAAASLDDEVFRGFDDDTHTDLQMPRQRENPYVAPVVASQDGGAKYVPPSLRHATGSDAEDLARLRRQVQGLLNKLSEANVITIVRDVERLYQSNARQYVTTALVDLLIASLADRTRLNDTFIVLHAGFVAALYKAIGVDFGASFIERVAAEFDIAYELESGAQDTKIAANLISLVSMLYNFQVITAMLVFDYVRLFLQSVSETNTELLLLTVRSCGTQLRQDDPSSLKDIVAMLHSAAAEAGGSNLSVRTKFMIETVNNLKNNRAKPGAAASAVVGEHITRLKKAIGTLPTRKASEPFRLSLTDLRNVEKKGKWWLVGASWKGESAADTSKQPSRKDDDLTMLTDAVDDGDGDADLITLAKSMGMNTEIRRAIFISVMSASDVKDAQLRLLKLHLKKAQEMEVPRVLIKCVGAEKTYNQYYTLIAQRLCSQDRRLQKAFQFSLWDLFRRMGERHEDDNDQDDDDEDEEQEITMRQLVNHGKMFGTLMAKGALSVTTLKVLSFEVLRSKSTAFLEVLFDTVFASMAAQGKPERRQAAVVEFFEDIRQAPALITGLHHFLENIVDGAIRPANNGKAKRKCCRAAIAELRRLKEDDFEAKI